MRNRVMGYLAFVALLMAVSARADLPLGENLLPNEGFEQVSRPGGAPDGWGFMKRGETVECAVEDGAVRLTVGSRDDVVYCVHSKDIAIEPNHYYALTIRIKLEDVSATSHRACVMCLWRTAEDETKQFFAWELAGTADWQTHRKVLKAPADAVNLRPIYLGVYRATGTAWFDDVALQEVTLPEDRFFPDKDISLISPPDPEISERRDIPEVMTAEEFWALIPQAELVDPPTDLWDVPLVRFQHFGVDFWRPGTTRWRDESIPRLEGALGQPVPEGQRFAIATDVKFNPIIGPHGSYSKRWYPRRMGQWAGSYYLPSFLMTGDDFFLQRGRDMLDYQLYSQWMPDGSNGFCQDHYAEDFARLTGEGWPAKWVGGYDYLFDWEWTDGYGYTWPLHSPDHHVCSGRAADMIMGYEVTGDRRYLDSAELFVREQLPHYGFHTGIWRGERYYWTEYSPTGEGNAVDDATDNIMALVAQPVAMLGYYLRDRRYLEYARGLVWYMVREWDTDKRWYYEGWENSMNSRYKISHDGSCTTAIRHALPYLLAAGLDCDTILEGLDEPWRFYMSLRGSRNPYVRGNKVMGSWEEARPGERLRFVTYVQVTGPGAREVRFADELPEGFVAGEPLTLLVTQPGADLSVTLETSVEQLVEGVALELPMQVGDIYRIEYAAICPEGFSPEPTPTDTAERPTVNPSVRGSRMLFINELDEECEQEFAAQTWETLRRVDADSFLSYPATLHFPRPDRRVVE